MTYLTAPQVELLLKRVHPNRVSVREGLAYMEAHDIKAEMNRIFGFARWSSVVTEQVCLREEQKKSNAGKDVWYVAYRTRVRITVCAPDGTELASYEEGHVGDSTHPVYGEAHGNAVTNSESYAFKRAAVMLGDQFGASLYNKGSREPLVRWTLVTPPTLGDAPTEAPDTSDVALVQPESFEVESAPDTHEQSEAPVEPDPDAKTLRVADLTAQLLQAKTGAAVRSVAVAIGKEGLVNALTYDADENAIQLGALLDAALKRVTRAS